MFRLVVIGLLTVALTPLSSLPVVAAPLRGLEVGHPEKMAPLGEGKASVTKAKDPTGDFSNPPEREGLAVKDTTPATQKGDHFDPQKSRLVDHTLTSDIYDNGDGTQSVDIYGTPVNFKNADGNWQKINSNLVVEKGKIRNTAGPVNFELAQTPSENNVGKIIVDGKSLSFGFAGASARKAAITKPTQATYLDVAPGVDLSYQVFGTRLKELITLHTRPAVVEPVYRFPIELSGLRGVTKENGTIVFQNDEGKDVIAIPQGFAWDSSPNGQLAIHQVAVSQRLVDDGKALEVSVPREFLDNATYPVTIDPTYDGYQVNSSNWRLRSKHRSRQEHQQNGISGQRRNCRYLLLRQCRPPHLNI